MQSGYVDTLMEEQLHPKPNPFAYWVPPPPPPNATEIAKHKPPAPSKAIAVRSTPHPVQLYTPLRTVVVQLVHLTPPAVDPQAGGESELPLTPQQAHAQRKLAPACLLEKLVARLVLLDGRSPARRILANLRGSTRVRQAIWTCYQIAQELLIKLDQDREQPAPTPMTEDRSFSFVCIVASSWEPCLQDCTLELVSRGLVHTWIGVMWK